MHIDQQPAVDKHGNRLTYMASAIFIRLNYSDPEYQRMLEEVMFEDTEAKRRNHSELIDMVCNERNNSAHPCNVDDLLTGRKSCVRFEVQGVSLLVHSNSKSRHQASNSVQLQNHLAPSQAAWSII